MNSKTLVKEVYELIGNAKITAALTLLKGYLNGSECFKTIILLQNRQKTIRRKVDEGIISHESEVTELNKVSESILSLCDSIKSGECEPISDIDKIKQLLNSINPEIINQLKGGKIGVRAYINQDNFNKLLEFQSNLSVMIVHTSRKKQRTTVISNDKLRSTVHLYDNKYGIAIECTIFSHPEFA
ncbi:MAG: hypothetical protein P1U70_06980 [Saprospiraceae bacterium]|jgi:hypothetical protein|nr:hypothetical protein [Saprospiraceae bacterium]